MTTPAVDPLSLLRDDVGAFNAWRAQNLGAALDFTEADLRGANLREAFLVGARMDRCRLDDATLHGARLSGASLDGASLRRADLRTARLGPSENASAELARSPLASAVIRAASLRGASLAAAVAIDADLRACDLRDADLTDVDLRGADLKGARMDKPVTSAPPSAEMGEVDALWARLGAEAPAVREGLMRFGLLVHLAGDQGEESCDFLDGMVDVLGFSEADVERMLPKEAVRLETMKITTASSHWARKATLEMMCALAGCTTPTKPMQLQVLGHFGEQLGFSDRAMARIIGEELGLDLRPTR